MIRSLLHFYTALLLAFAAASHAAPPFPTDVNRHSIVTAVPKLIYPDDDDPTVLVPGQNVLRKDFGGIPGTPVAAETDPERYHVGSPSIICITTTTGYPREYLVAFDRRPNTPFGLSYNLSSPDGNYTNDSPQTTIFKVTRSISTTEPPAEELLSAYQCTIPGIVGGSLSRKGDNIYLLGSGATVTTTNGVKTYASKPRITQLVLNAEGKYVAASLVDLTLNIPSYPVGYSLLTTEPAIYSYGTPVTETPTTTDITTTPGRFWKSYEETLVNSSGARIKRQFFISMPVNLTPTVGTAWIRTAGIEYGNWLNCEPKEAFWYAGNAIRRPDGTMAAMFAINTRAITNGNVTLTSNAATPAFTTNANRYEVAPIMSMSNGGLFPHPEWNHYWLKFHGQSKFSIREDASTSPNFRYYAVANRITCPHDSTHPAVPSPLGQRNVVSLMASNDLTNWEKRCDLFQWNQGCVIFRDGYVAFKEPDFIVDGDDLVFITATAWGNHISSYPTYISLGIKKNFRTDTTDFPSLY